MSCKLCSGLRFGPPPRGSKVISSDPEKIRAWRRRSAQKAINRRIRAIGGHIVASLVLEAARKMRQHGPWVPQKPKRRRGIPARVREAVKERSGGRCEWCQREKAVHMHHRLKRSQGGPDTVKNLMHLGVSCHDWTERNPSECFKHGLLLTRADAVREGIIEKV